MKKLVTWLLIAAFSLNVVASGSPLSELERSIDEFTYFTTVEWDQRDSSQYEAQSKAFLSRLSELKAQGLSQEEVVSLLEKKITDKKALESLRLKVKLLGEVSSEKDLKDLLSNRELYTQGASWSGTATVISAVSLLVMGLVAYSYWWSSTHDCVQYEEYYDCVASRCSGGQDNNECYGSYCGNFNKCVRYERKGN